MAARLQTDTFDNGFTGWRGRYCMRGCLRRPGEIPWLISDPRRLWPLALGLAVGCARTQADVREVLARRIAPERASEASGGPREKPPAPQRPARTDGDVRPTALASSEGPRPATPPARETSTLPPALP